MAKASADRDDNAKPKGGRSGPVDHGREGGMATREKAPEITERSDNE